MLVFLMFLFIPLLVMNQILYHNAIGILEEEAKYYHRGISNQINKLIEDQIANLDGLSITLHSQPYISILSKGQYIPDSLEKYNDTREMERLFSLLLTLSDQLEGIYIFTETGNRFFRSNLGYVVLPQNVFEEDWYQLVLAEGRKGVLFNAYIPWPLLKRQTGPEVFTLGRVLRNIRGENLGVLLIDVRRSLIDDIIDRYHMDSYSHIIVVDSSNHVVFSDSYHHRVGDKINDETLLEILYSGESGVNVTIEQNDYFVMLNTSDMFDWKIISITSQSEIQRHTNQIRLINIIIIGLSIVFAVAVIVIISLAIIKPIHKLNKAMSKVREGNFTIHVNIDSNDEIGKMGVNFNSMVDRINNLIEDEYKTRLLMKETEHRALLAQINPHFLYNTLQLVSSIAVVYDVEPIDQVTKSLGHMMRYSLRDLSEKVLFREELEHVRKYISIQEIRMGEKFKYVEDVQSEAMNCLMVKLILQPLVENAFIHGIERMKSAGLIRLTGKVDNGKLIIHIADNGKGMSEERLLYIRSSLESWNDESMRSISSQNIGLRNVYGRLYHFYGKDFELQINSVQGSGTEIVISLSLINP